MEGSTALNIVPIIGLEVHIQLATRTKMWCSCAAEFGRPPNERTCPTCLALPGALPVLNRRAVEQAVQTGLALNCSIARRTHWDRKNYFYPDLPKNYQISQFDQPLCRNGYIELKHDQKIRKIRISRAHLEEDAGKNIHDSSYGTAVDLNRAGTPLLEIVTEPDFRSAEEAVEFAMQLQRLVRYLGVSEANMQKGQMRFEPNVNLAIKLDGRETRTPIVEVKNLNSFRALYAAISYELDRQRDEWRTRVSAAPTNGKTNRGWDDVREITVPQREKEEPRDYRFFPDPDLVPLTIDPNWVAEVREHLPELPIPRTERFISEYKLTPQEAAALVDCRATADLLDQAAELGGDKVVLARQFLSFWQKLAHERQTTIAGLGIAARHIAELANLVKTQRVNASAAARIAEKMARRADDLLEKRAHENTAPSEVDSVALSSTSVNVDDSKTIRTALFSPAPNAMHARPRLQRPTTENCIIRFESLEEPDLCPLHWARRLGVLQTSDSREIAEWLEAALAAHPQAVADALQNTRKCKAAKHFLTGQVMKLSQGKANPRVVARLLEESLARRTQPPA